METSIKAIALEKLFIPLNFTAVPKKWNYAIEENEQNRKYLSELAYFQGNETPISNTGTIRSIIFSGPGGGKTSWLKYLISVYGLGEGKEIDERLPNRELFPIFIKCRDITENYNIPFFQQVAKITEQVFRDCDADLFKSFKDGLLSRINKQTALFLIDGLDEISDEESRQHFFDQIKVFATTFPKANIIMSSRNVGYKNITKNKFETLDFTYNCIRTFENEDIRRLCVDWHKVVVADTLDEEKKALALCDIILKHERIRVLCKSPILMTTLLMVNRRIGTLPFRRADLYAKVMEVLLVTWNSERFIPIDERQAMPYLSYLAHHMMFNRFFSKQTITKSELISVLKKAQRHLTAYELPGTIEEFLQTVELRSAPLVVRGYALTEDGVLEEEYEFLHLSFQEYLTAYAIIHKHYPGASASSTIVQHFGGANESSFGMFHYGTFREVILLTAVMADRFTAPTLTEAIIDKLEIFKNGRRGNESDVNYLKTLLLQMINDGALLSDGDREKIYTACFMPAVSSSIFDSNFHALYTSNHGQALRKNLLSFDEIRENKIFTPLLPVIDSYVKGDSNVYKHYEESRNTENHLQALESLSAATWTRYDYPKPSLDDFNRVKGYLSDDCMHEDIEIAKISMNVFYDICNKEDDMLTCDMMEALCRIFNVKCESNLLILASKFPINKETVLWLSGKDALIESSKVNLKLRMIKEKNTLNLLSMYLFGVFNGVWDFSTTLLIAKGYNDNIGSDCLDDETKAGLLTKMLQYVNVVREAGKLGEEEEKLAAEYEQEMKLFASYKKSPELLRAFNIRTTLQPEQDSLWNNTEEGNGMLDVTIAKCTLPPTLRRVNSNDPPEKEKELAIVKQNEKYYLSDQGSTYESLDRIFELEEPDVIKNLVAIMRNYDVTRYNKAFVLELKGWNCPDDPENVDWHDTFDTDEILRKAKYQLYACVSFMENMRIFYV